MKILYDHQAFAALRLGGIAGYFYNLMTALQQKNVDVELSIRYSNNHYLLNSHHFPVQPFRYILGYMNTNILISQINRIWNCIQPVRAGGGGFNVKETQLIQHLELAGRVMPYSIDDLSLYRLYHNALAFVYPSLYEDFSTPIMEAFATGYPVVTSIRQQIETILLNETLRQSLRQKGYERQLAFLPEK